MPVKAKYQFSFIDQADKQEPSHIRKLNTYDFSVKDNGRRTSEFIKKDVLENSEHLKDDSFTIRCDVVVIKDVDKGTASSFVTVPPPDMQRHFGDLLMAKEGTDVTFNVGGETFTAHRCVLAARSRVFKAELFGPMKEGSMVTAGVVHVEDMEARAFRAMLKFIYSDSEPEVDKEDYEDVMWQHLLAAADRYDLQRLKLMCEDKLCGLINVNTTTTILALAECHRCDGLKKACYGFLGAPGNLKAVAATDGFDHLIRSCPSVLKELIAMLAP
ncbi:BTB/POZ and MATH domain-containing protein 2-like [Lolium perenne]|uniref:BTB/POZ and MATH domain-containing protein 2-like n=1 Tax=Lolium perenne TaxID=4522 RepID=UPI003A991ED3